MTVFRTVLARAAIVLLATPFLPSDVRAQAISLEPGADLRLAVRGGTTLQGRLVRQEADSIVVHGSAVGSPAPVDRPFALEEVARLERRVPRSGWAGAGRGALWGALIGGLGGAAFGVAQDSSCGFCFSPGENALIGAAVFGIPGTLIGTVVGAASPGSTWEEVPLETVSPQPSGVSW